jgi:preprotein translocase subunit SecG
VGRVAAGGSYYHAPLMLQSALSVLQVFVAVILIFLILLHSGKDAGMSGAFGVGTAGGTTGGSLMERNLDRWTIFFAIVFAVNSVVLLKI